jgi:2-C-methyl-D-erythritol 2,4-cyclodiphosphate synthase
MCWRTRSRTRSRAPRAWAISECTFPDTDPQWKGCDSLVFLRHARDLAAQRGYAIVNVDSTIILERPKLKDFRQSIRERLAETLGLEVDRVSVKFKTAEKVGPVGEGRFGGTHRPW